MDPEKLKARAERFGSCNTSVVDKEKLESRAKRFNIPTTEGEAAKKKMRMERFGVPPTGQDVVSEEKIKARLAKFGGNGKKAEQKAEQKVEQKVEQKPEISAEELAQRKARAERFGIVDPQVEAEKAKARALKYGTLSETDKKKLREERFNGSKEQEKVSA